MDYRSIKIALIFLLIISSSIAYYKGMCSGFSALSLSVVNYNYESVYSDVSHKTGLPTVSSLEFQSINNNEYPVRPQYGNNTVDEVDNVIGYVRQYPIIRSQDLQNQPVLDHDFQVIVAILDTGIDADHEALDSVVTSEINFTDSQVGVMDAYGHGTPIAGIIAANGDNNSGVQGIASNCRLLNVKVVDDRGHYNMSDLVDGILWAVDYGANIINISLVSGEKSAELENAIDYAWHKGVLIVAAAGNGGTDTPVYPAAYEHCIAVTAVDDNSNLVPLANNGDWVDIAAPGYEVYSTLPGDNYSYFYGTSFATAYISGLAATMFPLVQDSNGDGKYNDEVRQLILNNYPVDRSQLVQN